MAKTKKGNGNGVIVLYKIIIYINNKLYSSPDKGSSIIIVTFERYVFCC